MVRRALVALAALFALQAPLAAMADPVLYLSTFGDNKIYKVLPDGSKTLFGPSLGGGSGLAFDTAGNLYADTYNTGTVLKIAPNGSSTLFASGMSSPYGMVFDTSGNLYVANSGNGTISKITAGGVVSTYASGLNQPLEIAIDSSNNIYSANPALGTIVKITTDQVVHPFISGLTTPSIMVFDSAGTLYASRVTGPGGTEAIGKYDSNGNFISDFAQGLAGNLYYMTFGQDTNMYVSTYPTGGSTNASILKITPQGTVSTYATGLTNPTGLAVPTPEPMTLGVVACGSALLLMRRRR